MISFSQWKTKGQYFNYQTHRIHYQQSAPEEGKPYLLLLHGYPTSSWDWHKLWQPLQQRFNLICFDFLGFGLSDKPLKHTYSVHEQASIAEALLDELKVTECSVLAHDYGDTILQELLARQQDGEQRFTIKAAAMLNGGIFQDVYEPILIQRLMISPLGKYLGALNNKWLFKASIQRVLEKKLSQEAINELWKLVCHNKGRTLLPKLQAYIFERTTYKTRWSEALIHAPCPIIYISGDNDTISGKNIREHYEQVVIHPKTVALNGVGHYPQLEAPQQATKHIINFLCN